MLKTYIKQTHRRLPLLSLLHLNLFSFTLTILFFFVLPLVIRRYYIIGNEWANVIKCAFLLLFEFSGIKVAIAIKDLQKMIASKEKLPLKRTSNKILKTYLYSIAKTFIFILFIYVFRLAIKSSLRLAFFVAFFYFFFIFALFWLPAIIANEELSFLKSVYRSACLFILHPFFTFFVFLHILFLFFLSIFLFNLYPGQSRIFFNINVAYKIIEKSKFIKY